MRALKALVIVMGIIIVAGVAVVVVTIVNRLQNKTPAAMTASGAAELGDVVLPLPAGCRVAEMTSANDRLWLRLEPLTGNSADAACADILILDPATGSVVGRLSPGTSG
jgi:uncharacterized protein DUF6476